jgi:hypothetical protein
MHPLQKLIFIVIIAGWLLGVAGFVAGKIDKDK